MEIEAINSGKQWPDPDYGLWELREEAGHLREDIGADYSEALKYLWDRSNTPQRQSPRCGHTPMDSSNEYCDRDENPLIVFRKVKSRG